MIASDAQGDTTRDPKTVTHTSSDKGNVTDNNNRNFEQNLLINRTFHVLVLTMNPWIGPRTVPIVVASRTLLMPNIKEVVADAACGGA